LRERVKNLWVIVHPLLDISDFGSYADVFPERRRYSVGFSQLSFGPKAYRFMSHVLAPILFVLGRREKFDIIIGIDPLNALMGLLLKRIGRTSAVIYFSVDYVPKRFQSRVMNAIYHRVDRLCVKSSDVLWNVSSRMARVREEQGVTGRNLIVPAGVNIGPIKKLSSQNKRAATLVFIGYLTRIKGVQLIIEAMPDIVKSVPMARLVVVGSGPMEDELKRLASGGGVEDCIEFLKPMPYEELMKLLSECSVGMAPYMPVQTSYSRWGDPMKIKEYAAFGLPIVMTNVPEIADEVEGEGVGIIVDYDRRQLTQAVVRILTDARLYSQMSERAVRFASGYDWSSIFARAFQQTLSQTRPSARPLAACLL
jgi:glycosyltransferase involved in cell wall biosynthesis